MKEVVTEFLTILANSVLVICLALMSFLLISNFYHYKEVSYSYSVDYTKNNDYNNYKKMLKKVDKKMKSVNYKSARYSTTAKPIYEYYESCVSSLNKGTFAKLDTKESITTLDIYNANNEVLKEYNSKCVFNIPYNISMIYKNIDGGKSFAETKKIVDEKRENIIDISDYLVHSQLGNSSYGFVTDITRGTIYNKLQNEYDLTVDNYNLIASLLDDIADWYVSEYGGNS